MKKILKLTPKIFLFMVTVFSIGSAMSCTALVPVATPTRTSTNTVTITPTKTLPTSTFTPTPTPLPTATSTPTGLELFNERTQFLFSEPASNVINFFLEIQNCLKTDNKEKLASLVFYPITIHSIDRKDVEIKNEKEFIANYEKIATPKWKDVILAQEPTKLFMNWQGMMVNRGEMWFGPLCIKTCSDMKYYIFSIMNDTPW